MRGRHVTLPRSRVDSYVQYTANHWPRLAMQSQDRTSPAPPATTSTDVFSLIHEIHATVTTSIDTALSWEQLNSPPVNYSLIRPIVEKYTQQGEDGKDEKGRVSSTLLSVPGGADGGESGNGNGQRASKGEELGLSLGAILYALMANRWVHVDICLIFPRY